LLILRAKPNKSFALVFVQPLAKELSRIRAQIAIGLVKTYGVALAEVARKLGVSTSVISKIVKRAAQ
jgi:DNA-directed RNA polymerase specialized sigma subunit